MSRTSPDPAEKVQLQLICTFCGSRAGRWCVTSGERWSQLLHTDRFYAAKAAGMLPVGGGP